MPTRFHGGSGRLMLFAAMVACAVPPAAAFVALCPEQGLSRPAWLGFLAVPIAAWALSGFFARRPARLEEERASLTALLQQADRQVSLGRMVGSVAHEINNPLMLIRESAGWMRDILDEPLDENARAELRGAAGKVEKQVDRAAGITRRVLGFGRSTVDAPAPMPLAPLLRRAVDFLHSEAARRGISLEVPPGAPDLLVLAQEGPLEQVLVNIIDNSLDAVGSRPHDSAAGWVRLEAFREGDRAVILIRDNGPGIPPEVLARIFDPFFSTKKPGEGTGLGLSVCRTLMEELHGTVEAESLSSGGAQFRLALPMALASDTTKKST